MMDYNLTEGARESGRSNDKLLKGEARQIERKMFYFDLRENAKGRFLRITEEVAGRRDSIVIPATGLKELCNIIVELLRFNEGN